MEAKRLETSSMDDLALYEVVPAPAVANPTFEEYHQPMSYPCRPMHHTEIRLLVLQPATLWKPITCRLRVFSVADKTPYEALSYTWGGSTQRRTIQLEGYPDFGVTDNLWYALRRLRLETKPRLLWIDALCINQRDLNERAREVSRMFDIYRSAQEVIVWLGEPHRKSTNCFSRLLWKPTRKVYQLMHRASGVVYEPIRMFRDCRKALISISKDVRPQWWDRAWVVQEVVAARSVMVYIGCYQLTWEDFTQQFVSNMLEPGSGFVVRCQRGQFMVVTDRSHFRTRIEALRRMQSWDPAEKRSLPDLLKATGHFSATDDKDKVYSLLGLLEPAYVDLIQVDYKKHSDSVFADATYATIKVDGTFNALFLISFRECIVPDLPSWTVDFTIGEWRRLPGQGLWHSSFWYTNQRDRDATKDVRRSQDARKLQAPGKTLDRVCAVGSAPWAQDHHQPAEPFQEVLQEAIDRAAHTDPLVGLRGLPDVPPWSARSPSDATDTTSLKAKPHAHADAMLRTTLQAWDRTAQPPAACRIENFPPNVALNMTAAWLYCYDVSPDLSMFATERGFVGYAPGRVAEGDVVVLLRGGQLPMLLRPGEKGYGFRGFAYVHGVVDMRESRSGIFAGWWGSSLEDEDFVIA